MSSFLLERSLLIPYACVSIEFEVILLISPIKTLYLSLLNLCCDFNINLLLL